MFGSGVLEVVLGLIFVYLLLSLLATTINELIANFLALRGKNLRKVISIMFDEAGNEIDFCSKFYAHPLIKKSSIRPVLNKLGLASPPAFLSNQTFSKVLLETLVDGHANNITPAQLEGKIDDIFPADSDTNRLLKGFVRDAADNLEHLRLNLENWYDDMMSHATEWYKSKVRVISLVIGLVLSVTFNADTFNIVQKLSTNPRARKAVVELAEKYQMDESTRAQHREDIEALFLQADSLVKSEIAMTGKLLGMSWKDESKRFGDLQLSKGKDWAWLFTKITGWLLTALAISLGAPFWFDMLSKVVNIREGGRKPREGAKG